MDAKERRQTDIDRFWRYVVKSDRCWTWTGTTLRRGYGIISAYDSTRGKRRGILAHRFSYELHYGLIPDGLLICHHCDNRVCVRPHHLFLGTSLDNAHDARKKGRSPAKLTEEDVRRIRALTREGGGQRAIAREFGVNHTTIRDILNGYIWRHIS